jgi:hypothetical protein
MAPEACPYLVCATTDWLSVSPLAVFCRRPDSHIRIPAAASLARCVDDYRRCEGYARCTRETAAQGDLDGR